MNLIRLNNNNINNENNIRVNKKTSKPAEKAQMKKDKMSRDMNE